MDMMIQGYRDLGIRGFMDLGLREAIKKRPSLGHGPKGGVQPESKNFEVVLLSPILATFQTLNEGRGGGG